MLRLLVLILVLCNAAYYAWSHEMFRAYGFGPLRQTEPNRLQQQIRPESLVILSTDATGRIEPQPQAQGPGAGVTCLQAGLFDETQATALRQGTPAILPDGTWSLNEVRVPPRWIVYMGKYADAQAVAKKRAEIAALSLRIEPLLSPALAPGFSLGVFESQEAAQAELALLVKRGVRTAEVVQERPESRATMMRITPLDEALRTRLGELTPLLAGKELRPCP